jgi:hypothetical protein
VSKTSERRFVGLRRSRSCGSIGFRLTAIELAHDIGANRPRGDLGGLRLLALPVRLLVNRADERAFDEHVSAFLDVSENGLSQPRAKYICYVESDFLRRAFASIKDRFVEGGCVSVRSRRERTDGRLTVWSMDRFHRFA